MYSMEEHNIMNNNLKTKLGHYPRSKGELTNQFHNLKNMTSKGITDDLFFLGYSWFMYI